MELDRAIEILGKEFGITDQGITKITKPNTEGADTVTGIRMSNGAWYMLRAAIKHVLEAAEQRSGKRE